MFLNRYSILLLIVVFKTQAQENTTNFLEEYFPVGAFIQFTNNAKGIVIKEDSTVNYDLLSYKSVQYGVVFNFYQTNNWNFKTGLILKPKKEKVALNFTKNQTGGSVNYAYKETVSGDDTMWSFPLIAEYLVPISSKVKWVIAPSFTISYYKDSGGYGLNSRQGVKIWHINDNRSSKWFHTSAELSTGFYFPFKHFMLQPELRYSKSFNTLKSGSYTTENYRTNPSSSTGTFKQTGDYWGFSLTFYMKKKGKNK